MRKTFARTADSGGKRSNKPSPLGDFQHRSAISNIDSAECKGMLKIGERRWLIAELRQPAARSITRRSLASELALFAPGSQIPADTPKSPPELCAQRRRRQNPYSPFLYLASAAAPSQMPQQTPRSAD